MCTSAGSLYLDQGRTAFRFAKPLVPVAALLLAGLTTACTARHAPSSREAAACAVPHPVPPDLAPAVIAAFEVPMTADDVIRTGVVRCVGGRMLACLTGANLNCGQADTRRRNQGAAAWCRTNPNADFVPAFATGHATIYAWRCAGPEAVIARQVQQVDAQGYVAGNWKAIGSR